ncbi:biotin/lipoyl-containing protein, partial [Patescibacteria group bacterium]
FPLFFGKVTIRRTSPPAPAYSAEMVQCSSTSQNCTDVHTTQDESHGVIEFKSPMVGTFHSLVTSHQDIREGEIVAIINALRLDNEIEIDISGQIIDVCVKTEIRSNGDNLFLR